MGILGSKQRAEIYEKGVGGISIIIRQERNGDIYEIARRSRRYVKITINNGGGKHTYYKHICAPYELPQKYKRLLLGDVKYLLEQRNSKNDAAIWTTDNNGKITHWDCENGEGGRNWGMALRRADRGRKW